MAKGITKVKSFYKSQQAKSGVKPIVREQWNSDDLAAKGLAIDSKKRVSPTQGARGSFDPQSNQKYK